MPRLSAAFSLGFLLLAAACAQGSESGQEYQQVRKIALRDSRVRDAFASANERLDAKIIALDPALSGYVRNHPSGRAESAQSEEAPVRHPFNAASASKTPKSQKTPKTPAEMPPVAHERSHTVAAGETLSSIAAQYGVSVSKLETANHIEDARKLPVGQVLTIP